ncbi:hypothetical protein SNEBB_004071 [Seison nebaliae]|nr:hypothetical protein SNEBB_004071 [Seison nebaliae]
MILTLLVFITLSRIGLIESRILQCSGRIGRCHARGDIHVTSFDGNRNDHQGHCKYTLTQAIDQSDPCWFSVDYKAIQDPRFPKINGIDTTSMKLFDVITPKAIIRADAQNRIKVNGQYRRLPYTNGNIKIKKNQDEIQIINSECKYAMHYDIKWTIIDLNIELCWEKWSENVRGICGNFDNDKENDHRDANGKLTPMTNFLQWSGAYSFEVTDDTDLETCERKEPIDKGPDKETDINVNEQERLDKYCRKIEENEIFQANCLKDQEDRLQMKWVLDDCKTDLIYQQTSNDEGDSDRLDDLCRYAEIFGKYCIEKYSDQLINWRSDIFCEFKCSLEEMLYYPRIRSCMKTCKDPEGAYCDAEDKVAHEGCLCFSGFYYHDEKCVPKEMCGCSHSLYGDIAYGESVVDDTCSLIITCLDNGEVKEAVAPKSCGLNAECKTDLAGFYKCQCIDGFEGDPYYICDKPMTIIDGIVGSTSNYVIYDIEQRLIGLDPKEKIPILIEYYESILKNSKNFVTTGVLCEQERVKLRCPVGYWIHIYAAFYGKFDDESGNDKCASVRSPDINVQYPCYAKNARRILMERCLFRTECGFLPTDQLFHARCDGISSQLVVKFVCLSTHLKDLIIGSGNLGEPEFTNSTIYPNPCELNYRFKTHKKTDAFCRISGDPHFKTFDEDYLHFQGVCKYTAARVNDIMDPCYFNVEVKAVRDESITFMNRVGSTLRVVDVITHEFRIRINHFEVQVNGEVVRLPYNAKSFIVFRTKKNIVQVKHKCCGYTVEYDQKFQADIIVPPYYENKLSGLCGNYNRNKSDDMMSAGGAVKGYGANPIHWLGGQSFQVEDDTLFERCDYLKPEPIFDYRYSPPKNLTIDELIEIDEICEEIATVPAFIECMKNHSSTVLQQIDNCKMDIAALYQDGPEEKQRTVQCRYGEITAQLCSSLMTVIFEWRSEQFCPIECPKNSYFSVASQDCPKTCIDPEGDDCDEDIITQTSEGCECIDGYLWHDRRCVERDNCGCTLPEGPTIELNEEVLDRTCKKILKCTAPGKIEERKSRNECGINAKCKTNSEGYYDCICMKGFIGDPWVGCDVPVKEYESPTGRIDIEFEYESVDTIITKNVDVFSVLLEFYLRLIQKEHSFVNTGTLCENDVVYLRCPKQSTIHIKSAFFGRVNKVLGFYECPVTGPSFTDWNEKKEYCYTQNINKILNNLCKPTDHECQIDITSTNFPNNCPSFGKIFALKYTCLPMQQIFEELTYEERRAKREKLRRERWERERIKSLKFQYNDTSYVECSEKDWQKKFDDGEYKSASVSMYDVGQTIHHIKEKTIDKLAKEEVIKRLKLFNLIELQRRQARAALVLLVQRNRAANIDVSKLIINSWNDLLQNYSKNIEEFHFEEIDEVREIAFRDKPSAYLIDNFLSKNQSLVNKYLKLNNPNQTIYQSVYHQTKNVHDSSKFLELQKLYQKKNVKLLNDDDFVVEKDPCGCVKPKILIPFIPPIEKIKPLKQITPLSSNMQPLRQLSGLKPLTGLNGLKPLTGLSGIDRQNGINPIEELQPIRSIDDEWGIYLNDATEYEKASDNSFNIKLGTLRAPFWKDYNTLPELNTIWLAQCHIIVNDEMEEKIEKMVNQQDDKLKKEIERISEDEKIRSKMRIQIKIDNENAKIIEEKNRTKNSEEMEMIAIETFHKRMANLTDRIIQINDRRQTNKIKKYGECIAKGDPHYVTFDGMAFSFQGVCKYMLASVKNKNHLCWFSVEQKNIPFIIAKRKTKFSVTRLIDVKVDTKHIRIYNGNVEINGYRKTMPTYLSYHNIPDVISVRRMGLRSIIVTHELCGWSVEYDSQFKVSVKVPDILQNQMTGLCGNFDGMAANDNQDSFGESTQIVGRSNWLGAYTFEVVDDTSFSTCEKMGAEIHLLKDNIINMKATRYTKSKIYARECESAMNIASFDYCRKEYPDLFFETIQDCTSDLEAIGKDDLNEMNEFLCNYAESIAMHCEKNLKRSIQWRNDEFCKFNCPENSQYKPAFSGCIKSCDDPDGDHCPFDDHIKRERCVCNEGYLHSDKKCVKKDECSCYALDIGQIPYGVTTRSDQCESEVTCSKNSEIVVNKESEPCSPRAECKTNSMGMNRCVCKMGYEGDGIKCTKVKYNCRAICSPSNICQHLFITDDMKGHDILQILRLFTPQSKLRNEYDICLPHSTMNLENDEVADQFVSTFHLEHNFEQYEFARKQTVTNQFLDGTYIGCLNAPSCFGNEVCFGVHVKVNVARKIDSRLLKILEYKSNKKNLPYFVKVPLCLSSKAYLRKRSVSHILQLFWNNWLKRNSWQKFLIDYANRFQIFNNIQTKCSTFKCDDIQTECRTILMDHLTAERIDKKFANLLVHQHPKLLSDKLPLSFCIRKDFPSTSYMASLQWYWDDWNTRHDYYSWMSRYDSEPKPSTNITGEITVLFEHPDMQNDWIVI